MPNTPTHVACMHPSCFHLSTHRLPCLSLSLSLRTGRESDEFAFSDLSDGMVALGCGLLIGWRRNKGEVVINPPDKSALMKWRRGDELIVIARVEH